MVHCVLPFLSKSTISIAKTTIPAFTQPAVATHVKPLTLTVTVHAEFQAQPHISRNPTNSKILTTTHQHTRAAGSMHNLRCAAPLRTPGAHSVGSRLGWFPSRHQQQQSRRLGPPAAATAGSSDDDDAMPAQPDIDQLAAFLTQKAAEMRASMDEQDLLPPEPRPAEDAPPESSTSSDEAASTSDTLLSLDSLLASADAAVPAGAALPGAEGPMSTLDAVSEFEDDRGFISQDFAIVKLLGKLGVQDAASSPSTSGAATPSADPGSSSSGLTPNIIVYAARYNSGLPYEGPVTVQLREYLAGSRRVALNELLVQERLVGPLPQAKWEAAVADADSSCPVVPLLGYLQAPPSDEAFEMTQDPADTVWLVYKFEGMRPMSLMLQQMDLPEEPAGLTALFKSKEEVVAAALAARRRLLVSIASGLLSAISYCHQRGVAHCGIGAGCVVINTWSDKDVGRLLVKLDNFGLARVYQHPLEYGLDQLGAPQLMPALDSSSSGTGSSGVLLGLEDTDAALQRQEDLQAAALLLCEVFLVGAATAGAEVMDIASLKRLLFDVFHEDVSLFKEYCVQDEDNYCGFVEFMDAEGGAGWELLEALMKGGTAAGELLRTARFFTPATEASSSTSSSGGGSGGSLA